LREHRERHPEPPHVQRQAGDRELPPLAGATPTERAAALVDRVTATRATFTKADVQRAAFHERDSRPTARMALDRNETVIVGKDARGVTRYASADYLRDEARLSSTPPASSPPATSSASIPATSSALSTASPISPRSSRGPSSPPHPRRPRPHRRPHRRRQDQRRDGKWPPAKRSLEHTAAILNRAWGGVRYT
jgi:hypothetical protein